MSDQQTIDWLRGLAEKGGKGVVNNIDARCLGRIAERIKYLTATEANEILRLRRALEEILKDGPIWRAQRIAREALAGAVGG